MDNEARLFRVRALYKIGVEFHRELASMLDDSTDDHVAALLHKTMLCVESGGMTLEALMEELLRTRLSPELRGDPVPRVATAVAQCHLACHLSCNGCACANPPRVKAFDPLGAEAVKVIRGVYFDRTLAHSR